MRRHLPHLRRHDRPRTPRQNNVIFQRPISYIDILNSLCHFYDVCSGASMALAIRRAFTAYAASAAYGLGRRLFGRFAASIRRRALRSLCWHTYARFLPLFKNARRALLLLTCTFRRGFLTIWMIDFAIILIVTAGVIMSSAT